MLQLIIEGWGYITLEQIPHYTDIATLHPNPRGCKLNCVSKE